MRIDDLLGSPSRPFTSDQQEAKVRTCLGAVFADDARTERLISAVRGLPQATDARQLLDPITRPAPAES